MKLDTRPTNELLNKLNAEEIIRSHINDFIELFVEYYGEKERNFIEDRFNNAILTGYLRESDIEQSIREIKQNVSDEIFNKIISNTNLKVTINDLFADYSFEYPSLFPITRYEKFYDEYIKTKEERYKEYIDRNYNALKSFIKTLTKEEFMEMLETKHVPERFKNIKKETQEFMLQYADTSDIDNKYNRLKKDAVDFLQTIDSSITIENIEERIPSLTEINNLLELYKQGKEEYNEKIKDYQKYIDIIDYNKKLEKQLNTKYLNIYSEYVKKFIPQNLYNLIEEKKSLGKSTYNEENAIEQIIGSNILYSGNIDYFSSESESKLNNPNVSSWEKDIITRERVNYFKNIGIDLGNEYENYIERKDIFPNIDEIDKLIKIKDKIVNQYNIEYYNNQFSQLKISKEGKEKGFLDENVIEAADIYMANSNMGATCVNPNIVLKNGTYEVTGKVYINANDDDIDHKIIHELNHLYELVIVEVMGKEYTLNCGWDIINGKIGKYGEEDIIEPNPEKRKYELFNEIINERIAKEITQLMEDKNIYILNNPNKKERHSTGYDSTNYIINNFFKTYKKKILESRKNNNLKAIYDAVGKENFDALNELFKIHNDNFSGMRIYGLYNDQRNNKETERTKVFNDICIKRDIILESMKEHYQSYQEKLIKGEQL